MTAMLANASESQPHGASVATAEAADEDMSMEDFAAALESFDREQAAEAAAAQRLTAEEASSRAPWSR